MGAGASTAGKDLSKAEAQELAGAKFDEAKWEAAEKTAEGKISSATWTKAIIDCGMLGNALNHK